MSKNKYSQNYYNVISKYKGFHINGTDKLSGPKTFLGHSLVKWIVKIKDIIILSSSKSIIDYGCGKAFLYEKKINILNRDYRNLQEYWDLQDIYLYDPAVEKYSEEPTKRADGIICTDVIEHIPEEDIITFINDLFKLANKFIFVVIATVPASKYFDDGRNIHLCIKTENEWKGIFMRFKKKYPDIDQHIYFNDNQYKM